MNEFGVFPTHAFQDPSEPGRMRRLIGKLLSSTVAIQFAIPIAIQVGCTRGPTAVEVPPIQPDEAARRALENYDANGDDQLSLEELQACPAIRNVIGRYDQDGDGQISQDELSKRFAMWVSGRVAVTTLACNVTLAGRPLAGARIELIPETFLADAVQPAKGVTDESGSAILGIDPAHLPDDMKDLQGVVHQGVFRVQITHPEVDIPAKYNANTELGLEVSADTGENFVRWRL